MSSGGLPQSVSYMVSTETFGLTWRVDHENTDVPRAGMIGITAARVLGDGVEVIVAGSK